MPGSLSTPTPGMGHHKGPAPVADSVPRSWVHRAGCDRISWGARRWTDAARPRHRAGSHGLSAILLIDCFDLASLSSTVL